MGVSGVLPAGYCTDSVLHLFVTLWLLISRYTSFAGRRGPNPTHAHHEVLPAIISSGVWLGVQGLRIVHGAGG